MILQQIIDNNFFQTFIFTSIMPGQPWVFIQQQQKPQDPNLVQA